MKTNQIAEGGIWRLLNGQKALSSEPFETKYAAELAKASPVEKKEIYQRMLEEQERRGEDDESQAVTEFFVVNVASGFAAGIESWPIIGAD